MRAICTGVLGVSALAFGAGAQPFQIVSTVAPPFSVPESQWRSVLRFSLTGSGSAATPMSSIPDGEVHDPVGVGFRTPTDLFIGNRHGNTLGLGSVSRFKLTNGGATATFVSNFTQPGMVGVHEIAFNPVTRELFCTAVFDGIWRFTFDSNGLPVANGSFARGRGWRGVCIEPTGQYLYASAFNSNVYRFRINGDGSMTELPAQGLSGAANLHFFSLGPKQGEIYVADIDASKVHRLRVNADGSLTQLGAITSTHAIDCAFSPAGTEMFVSRHIDGGIDRFNYNAGTDSWVYSSTIATAESLGGFAAYVPAACPADLTGEGFVDDSDFVIFAQAYNLLDCEDPMMPLGCPADFNLDGFVDDADFVIFVTAYNELVCS
ncbi:MAG: hypothetical protein U0570_04345 [Phycisphaerales bacterium]